MCTTKAREEALNNVVQMASNLLDKLDELEGQITYCWEIADEHGIAHREGEYRKAQKDLVEAVLSVQLFEH